MRLTPIPTPTISGPRNGGSISFAPALGRGPQGIPGPGSAAWVPGEAVATGAIRQAPDGSYIKATVNHTTRPSFDATEQGYWISVGADPTTFDGKALSASIDDRVGGYTGPGAASLLRRDAGVLSYVAEKEVGALGRAMLHGLVAEDASAAAANTALIQAAIDNNVRGRGVHNFLPSGKFYYDSTLIVPAASVLEGLSAQPGAVLQYSDGTELCYVGADGTDAIVTAVDAETDWSRGMIMNLRVSDGRYGTGSPPTTGYGIVGRNWQNCALLYNVTVRDFPDAQLKLIETKTTGTQGATPGVAFVDLCFFIGGKRQIEYHAGSQPVKFSRGSCDTTVATVSESILIVDGPIASSARANPVNFSSWKVEVATATVGDIVPWKHQGQAPLHLDSCEAQRNSASMNVNANCGVVEHTNTTKKWPRLTITNMAAWNFAYAVRALSAGFDLINPNGTSSHSAWAFSFDWSKGDNVAVTFIYPDAAPSLNTVTMPLNGVYADRTTRSGGVGRQPMPSPFILTGITVASSAAVTAGSASFSVVKNGSTFVTSTALNTATPQRRSVNLLSPDMAAATPANQCGAVDDGFSVLLTTSADFAPASGATLAVTLLMRLYSQGG